MRNVEGSKLSVGQKVFIIESNLEIAEKIVLAVVVEENDFRYKLDTYSCGGSERKEIFLKKSEAEVAIKNFLDNLKFRIGDLVIFNTREYGSDRIDIGRIAKIEYKSDKSYEIRGISKSYYCAKDADMILKVKNEYIENYGDLVQLHEEWEKKDKELNEIRNKIEKELDKLEKELKYSFKRYYGWNLLRNKPKFEDRFDRRME